MNRLQKTAWFILSALTVILLLSGGLLLWVGKHAGASHMVKGFAGLGDAWLLGILFIMAGCEVSAKRRRGNEATFDERDLKIQTKGLLIGAFVYLGGLAWLRWLVVPSEGPIKIWLPLTLGTTAVAPAFAYSISILVQYGRGGKGGEETD